MLAPHMLAPADAGWGRATGFEETTPSSMHLHDHSTPETALQAGTVVHVCGRIDDALFSFLGPATAALAEAGLPQCVLLIEDDRHAELVRRFDPRVELLAVPAEGSALARWRSLGKALRALVRERRLRAVHLHGLAPLVWARGIARGAGPQVPVYFSPHAAPSLGPRAAFGMRAGRLFRGLLVADGQRTIVNMLEEAAALHRATQAPMQVVESAVPAVFLRTPLHEAKRPLIVTGSRSDDRRSVELFAQLAVLLTGTDLGLSFNWIGKLGEASVARLKAANVGYFEVDDDAEIASRMAAGWIYLAPSGGMPGFPVFLAAAMALGLPCVVVGSPEHSDLVRDGETGYLCRNDAEVMHRIGRLIDEPLLRRQIGQAARDEATSRFSPERFRDSLLAAYDLPEAQTELPPPSDEQTADTLPDVLHLSRG